MDALNHEFLFFLRCAQKNGLRYLLIGGYAVNFHGYVRNTADMDVWVAPTNENKNQFINTLFCMKYAQSEIADLYTEDFTKPWIGTIGTGVGEIDVLTIVHHELLFDEAEKKKVCLK